MSALDIVGDLHSIHQNLLLCLTCTSLLNSVCNWTCDSAEIECVKSQYPPKINKHHVKICLQSIIHKSRRQGFHESPHQRASKYFPANPSVFAYALPLPPSHLLLSLVLCQSQQLFDEKIKDCKEDESRRVSTSSRALLSVSRLLGWCWCH